MYQVSIFNNGVETIIHYPSADKDTPHILTMPHMESLSNPDQLSFSIPLVNPGHSLIQGLSTKVKVYDTRDNSVIFSGRVIPTKDSIGSDGKLTKEVSCEGALAYLNDTNTRRWNFINNTPSYILSYLLAQHNSKVDAERKIHLGVVEITQPLTIDTNYETTLNAIVTKLRNILGGDIRVQERSGVLYLDYLTDQGHNNGVKIELGYNLKNIIREYDPINIITRVIPLGYGEGINQLDITRVNSGLDYIQDSTAVSKYGVIESVATNKDIQDASTLKVYGRTVLDSNKTPRLTYEQTALDLSVLPGHENEKYELGDSIRTIVEVLGIDVVARIVERNRDLILNPWNPTLTISTRPIRLSNQIIELKQRNLTLENAPQGSTYIDTFGYADNVDEFHPFKIPIWLSPDIINVNRVRVHIESQMFRTYEKGAYAGGSINTTSGASSAISSGASSETSSGQSSATTSGASSTTSSGASSSSTTGSGGSINDTTTQQTTSGSSNSGPFTSYIESNANTLTTAMNDTISLTEWDHAHRIANHYHSVSVGSHSHGMSHTHDINHFHTMDHYHNIEHNHNIEHTHTIVIEPHEHELMYGIYESGLAKFVFVNINGVEVAGPYGYYGEAFTLELDLTDYINEPGQVYNLEITSIENGRFNVWVSIQAFIQAK